MRTTRVAVGLALAASLFTGLAARAEDPGITDKAIKIGIFGPLSGPNMAYGFDVVNAAKMYYDKINKEGDSRKKLTANITVPGRLSCWGLW